MKKQNKVMRLLEQIETQPHLITQQAFNSVMQYLDRRNEGLLAQLDADMPERDDGEDDDENYNSTLKLGIINIHGTLTNKPIYGMCGEVGMSYQKMLEEAQELIGKGAKTIVLDVDSGGGQAFNCMIAAASLRKMCDEANVELISYVQSCGCSAAYALAVVADEVLCHPQGEVGSIGVLICLMNDSEYLKKNGFRRTFISAGKDKVPFDDDGEWKDSFLKDLEKKVDVLYKEFTEHVAAYTGLPEQEIIDTEANTYMAKEALNMGLINGIFTNEEFTKYLVAKQVEKGVV